MFARGDQILIEQREAEFPLHALDFHWDGFEPGLTCYDTRDGGVSEFDLDDVGFAASNRKTCIGYYDDGGKYIKCPKSTAVTRLPQCVECSEESFLPYQECLFEPKCDGELCDIEFCRREHVLYIAFYDTRMKIGMSSTRRVERRLIEQGADAFSIIGKFATRKKAREAEKDISSRLRLAQSFRQEALLRNFSRSVDVQGIRGRHEALSITLGEAYQLSPEPLRWLTGYPIQLPLGHVPKLVPSWGSHRGELVGIKGKWLLYESEGVKALNFADLEARFLTRDLL